MEKKFSIIKKFALSAVCLVFFICFACLYSKNETVNAEHDNAALSVWQIDSFEGGKGSRAEFLQTVGKEFTKKENCYINVVSLSADAARINLSMGSVPDLISYGAGMYGIENYVNKYYVWCNGTYCFLSLDMNCDFSDVKDENTVINKGKDNFTAIAALLCGVQGGTFENSTAAYVKLINGDYKYLLGTQRDIFRLKTRNVGFVVKPITEFNDLYQNISITNKSENIIYAQRYIDFLLSKKNSLHKIGMFGDEVKLYADELAACENIKYEHKLTYPINKAIKDSLDRSILLGDINMLKELLK